ncbi:acyl-CoA dehydrogenase family protein [Magnetospirillum sulfuroxidans]|uniref:Acyl-CoA/acyl-ACP dehydrogenase n=1 Tax=Magnetospirillum sulfuroxidans TaxID=611300 RepID=A0ABS5IDI7_9PROT|nr:acyl-CoA dehydrogenase family protein [Magnetospirillum sulfuroxidans]MBR9972493.1 acyl-CoA/acyl-ACP dehydrogenase [Magnetospirillum sulfuroxidans]
MTASLLIADLIPTCETALETVRGLHAAAKDSVTAMVSTDGKIDSARFEANQQAAHGYAWLSTYVAALEQMLDWAKRIDADGKFGELEQLMLQSAYGEYCAQMYGGIPMSQGEIIRPIDLGLDSATCHQHHSEAVSLLRKTGNAAAVRVRIAQLIEDGHHYGELALGDETLGMIRDQFRRFVDDNVAPYCHEWHLKDELIPLDVLNGVAEMGVFGLTLPEEFGGLGMGKTAMCVVTEELSRGYIGVGSLGTRAEIAGELIRLGGTQEQKEEWLPKIASGEILPTAVFTEPNTGSDLGSLRTRAVKDGDDYVVTGNKTWITHASRTDVMTLLVRTNPDTKDWKGLSMFLAPKQRGTEDDLFPSEGMTGGEIKVLGYRGMKEYELGFDGFKVPAANLLGGVEGQGFKQLMETFESARIQTAARAVGVAQNAMEIGQQYAKDRVQFGKAIYNFPRVACKIAWMAVETMIARQLTYFSAREKDGGHRCDIEAGMAKLLAARVAWSNADNALQVHGGNGYAEEYQISRVLCDARILNIFEGAAEIQAQVIARGLLSGARG